MGTEKKESQYRPELIHYFNVLNQVKVWSRDPIGDTERLTKTPPRLDRSIGTMETLAKEVQLNILQRCDLESLVALRHTCRSFYKCLDDFDEFLVREKVLERAPWFQTDSKLDSWNACACVLVSRTRACLSGQDCKTGWFLMNDLRAAMCLEPKTTLVDPVDFSDFKEDSQMLFPDSFFNTAGSWHSQGTKVLVRGMELDLTTMEAGPNSYCPDKLDSATTTRTYSDSSITSPSGLKLRSHDGKNRIQVMDENDKLLLMRVQTGPDDEDEYDDDRYGPTLLSFALEDKEHVIYKDTCPRDKEGVLIIDPENLLEMDLDRLYGMAFFKLLPGAGGALVTKLYCSEEDPDYLAYIAPTAELRHSVITFLPSVRRPQAIDYERALPKNFFLYNGFLFYYFEGRLFRLWVDLGVEKKIERSRVKSHRHLPQKYDTQCLVGCHGLFPALGTFCEQSVNYDRHDLIQGSKEKGLDRYVTVSQSSGRVVADLKTGRTWQVNEFSDIKHQMFPWLEGDEGEKEVKFYKLDNHVCSHLQKKMSAMKPEQKKKRFSFTKIYNSLNVEAITLRQSDTRTLVPRPLYYSYDGAGFPPVLGTYSRGGPSSTGTCSDDKYGAPEDYKMTQLMRDEMKDVSIEVDDANYDSEEEYSRAVTAYDRTMDEHINLVSEGHQAEQWYALYDEVHKRCGSQTTNDPSDPANVAARKTFMSGVFAGMVSQIPDPTPTDLAFSMGYCLCQKKRSVAYGPPCCFDDSYN